LNHSLINPLKISHSSSIWIQQSQIITSFTKKLELIKIEVGNKAMDTS